jgi:hypothetical protein
MSNATKIELKQTNDKTGSVLVTFEISFPNEECEERERAFELLGRLMREALRTPAEREQFLAALENAKRETFGS